MYRRLRMARRISQVVFFAFFLVLLLHTSITGPDTQGAASSTRFPVGFFLEIDPLNALASFLSTHELYRNMLWSVVLIVLTIFLGRFFCGWICPMGTVNHMVSYLNRRARKHRAIIESNRYRPYQRWKYIVLFVFLGAALVTSLDVGLMDPIAMLTRSMALVVIPAYDLTLAGTAAFLSGFQLDFLSLAATGIQFLATRANTALFQGSTLVAVVFAAVLIANRFVTRFWCRGLCPLGALMGLLSRFSIFGLQKIESNCTQCAICTLDCQGADDPQPGRVWRQNECHLCLNCVGACPEHALEFKFKPSLAATTHKTDITRRTLLASVATGVIAVPMLRSDTAIEKGAEPGLIRPPGSVREQDFLARCIRCGECMNVCPTNALHPTFMQAGIEGIWSPMLVPRIGYCDPTCVQCSVVCPTGAIDEITSEEKAWVPMRGQEKVQGTPIRIGTAFYDIGRCLPWSMATQCIVCEEWCPVSPKAIYFEEVEVVDGRGELVMLKRPHVDPNLCVGCGACSFACPVKGDPAIYVRSVGETRNAGNRIVLQSSTSNKQ
jgi:polyferredoxin